MCGRAVTNKDIAKAKETDQSYSMTNHMDAIMNTLKEFEEENKKKNLEIEQMRKEREIEKRIRQVEKIIQYWHWLHVRRNHFQTSSDSTTWGSYSTLKVVWQVFQRLHSINVRSAWRTSVHMGGV
ncbi:unnamed protein product [Cuscuta epithymum]|uniref:Uncharacterized protein n=1 Tax=Cuscuta epithymum TaxID=186058 RepID=A0AAV0E8D5_9ASTE|nr:unnamed protein product [Cuscuta epithymum]